MSGRCECDSEGLVRGNGEEVGKGAEEMERTAVEVEALGEIRGEEREGKGVVRTGEDEVDNGKGLEVVLAGIHKLFEGVIPIACRHILGGGGFSPAEEEEEIQWKRPPRRWKHLVAVVNKQRCTLSNSHCGPAARIHIT